MEKVIDIQERRKEFDRLWTMWFHCAIEREDVHYEAKEDFNWLRMTFYIKSIKTYMPSIDNNIWQSTVCAFWIEWLTPMWALARAIGFYVHFGVQREQDVNGILYENVLVKKEKHG